MADTGNHLGGLRPGAQRFAWSRSGKAMPVFACLGLVAVLLGPVAAAAQTIDNKLRDVRRMALAFEPFDGDSAKCGVSEGALTRSIDSEVKQLPVRFDGSNYIMQVRVVTLAQPDICFTSADISLYRFEELRLTGEPRDVHAKVIIWENGAVLGSDPRSHGLDVVSSMRAMIRSFVEDWKKDNG